MQVHQALASCRHPNGPVMAVRLLEESWQLWMETKVTGLICSNQFLVIAHTDFQGLGNFAFFRHALEGSLQFNDSTFNCLAFS